MSGVCPLCPACPDLASLRLGSTPASWARGLTSGASSSRALARWGRAGSCDVSPRLSAPARASFPCYSRPARARPGAPNVVMTLLVRIQRKERHAATLLFTSRPWRDAGLPQRRPRSGRLSGEASREEAGDSCSPAWRRAEDGVFVPGRAASDRRTPSFSLLEERMKESR